MGTRLSWLDAAVILLYFAGTIAMGLWVARRVKSSQGYFLGDRRLNWWIMAGQSFGTGTHAEQPVAQAGATFELGFATIWYQWKNMLITPFYWLLAPWYRRSQHTTIGEIIEDRYGRKLAFLYTLFAISYFVFNQGAMLKGAGKVISIASGHEAVSANAVVVAMTVAFIVYSFFGGLVASAYTDFAQSFLIILLSFLLLPKGLIRVGGFDGLHQSLPPGFFNLYSEVSGLTAFTIAMLALNGLVGIVAQPHMLSMYASGRNERAGRVGMTYGSMVKRFCTIGWALTGLIVAAMVAREGHVLPEREAAFGFACRELLGPGFVGLMIASILAANMSTCSNFMVNTGALFTRNLFREYIRPNAEDRQLLLVGRLSGLALTLLGVVFALTVDRVLDAFLFTETIAALMGIMFFGGFVWKRANRWGAWAATISAFGVYYFLNYLMTCRAAVDAAGLKSLGAAWAELMQQGRTGDTGAFLMTGKLALVYTWNAACFGWAMLAGFTALVVVSLLTRPEDPERVRAFFDKQYYSSDEEDRLISAAERGQDLVLLDMTTWFTAARWHGFIHRYREDLVGFALGWGTVAVLVGMAWGIIRIGG